VFVYVLYQKHPVVKSHFVLYLQPKTVYVHVVLKRLFLNFQVLRFRM